MYADIFLETELFGSAFRSVSDKLLIKKDFTLVQSPQYSGVAERGLGIIEAAEMATRIQEKTKNCGPGLCTGHALTYGLHRQPERDVVWDSEPC